MTPDTIPAYQNKTQSHIYWKMIILKLLTLKYNHELNLKNLMTSSNFLSI
jgi:hypothetical protein